MERQQFQMSERYVEIDIALPNKIGGEITMAHLPRVGGIDRPIRLRAKNAQSRNVTGKPAKAVGSANMRTIPRSN